MVGAVHRAPTFADAIVTALSRTPNSVALVDRLGSTTYRRARARVMQMARALARNGLRADDGVALLSGNTTDAWLSLAAAVLNGCRYTPLHPLGSLDDHLYIIAHADIRAVIYDPIAYGDHAAELAERASSVLFLATGEPTVGADLCALSLDESADTLQPTVDANGLVALPYTGGTTGRPKGVMLSHRSLVHNLLQALADWQWPEHIIFLATTPITHGAGPMVLPTLLRGGTVVLEPSFRPEAFCDVVNRLRVTTTFLVPTMIYNLLDYLERSGSQLPSLDTVIYGAAAMSPTRLAQALDRLGPIFMQLYAQTEAPNTVCRLPKEDHDVNRPQLLASCGSPVVGIDVEVHDEADHPLGPGMVGEICVRGPLVMEGYWKEPELSAEALRNGWLHTGDLARFDEDGYLFIVDRAKDMIVTGGFNVFPREIEDVLTSHPAVAAAVVIGIPDDHWGEAVTAIVVLRPGANIEVDELVKLVRAKKGAVHAPKHVEFVDTLPLTPYGKPDKKAIRASYWAGRERLVH